MRVNDKDEVSLDRSVEDIWAEAEAALEKLVKKATFEAWVRTMQLQSITATHAVVAVANQFAKDHVTANIFADLRKALSKAAGHDVDLTIVVDEKIMSTPSDYAPSIGAITVAPTAPVSSSAGAGAGTAGGGSFEQAMRSQATNLNPRYTLESFVVGSNNRFCHSAAVAVANNPGHTYNPLFIYGGVGLGKTHLMHAIGHRAAANNQRMVVRYITCERFTNDLINSIRENKMLEFRKRYRQVDVLLVDDIQFIEGKESTQEEFFHTFNALRESGRQIVLSSDRPPKEIPKLEERLRSRFEWGLIADIQAPDLETRMAILRKKSEDDRLQVSDAVIEYIAATVTTNIRELEGALTRAHAYASLTGEPLNLQTASSVLQIGSPVSRNTSLTVEDIIGAVASHYKVDTSDLRSSKRSADLALPRHVAMFLMHEILKLSHARVGEALGNRKHSSVIYAIDKIKAELAENVQLSQAVAQIRRQLSN